MQTVDSAKGPSTEDPVLGVIIGRLVEIFRPDRIYLFGSAARGDAGPDSDPGGNARHGSCVSGVVAARSGGGPAGLIRRPPPLASLSAYDRSAGGQAVVCSLIPRAFRALPR